MLRRLIALLPPTIAQFGFRLAHRIRVPLNRLLKPKLRSVSVVAVDPRGRLLFVRTSYGARNWQFPGGAIERGESAEQAARREFREETGCDLRAVREIAVIEEQVIGTTATTHIFGGSFEGAPTADGREIIEVAAFARDALPPKLTARTWTRVRAYDEQGAAPLQQR